MQVMVIVKASPEDEKRAPNTEEFAAMGKFNEELVEAGIMLTGEGLLPSATGKRVKFGNGKPSVVDGPFTESKELVAGFWIWKVKSMDEALSWAKRIPFHEGEVEVRQIATAEDLGAEFTPELRAQEDALRERLSKQ
jgi:hypothetical protein